MAQRAGVDRERHALLLRQERLKGNGCLHSSEGGTQAEMFPESEAEMRFDIWAVHHEAVRLGEFAFVSFGRAPAQGHCGPFCPPRAAHPEHLARHRLADIALDTHHHNGGVTTLDALWAGVPVVTIARAAHSARTGASLLSALELPALIFNDLSGDGALSRQAPGEEGADFFIYSPAAPVERLGGHSCCLPNRAPLGPADPPRKE